MKIIVQKFGGTSVSTHEIRQMVVDKILKAKEKGFLPVVVVSAMGRRKDEPYATDTLLSLVSPQFKQENLLAVDLLLNCGEILSAVIMCNELFSRNIKAVPLTGGQAGIITDDNYSNASVCKIDTSRILNLLSEGIIPVIAGFQGVSKNGYFTTLGRGASDYTAAILGARLDAEEVEIYTDVDGIMTADPRIVDEATLIEQIDYDEVFQFADQGAKVIHPRAVEVAKEANLPLSVKNTLNNCTGTKIDKFGKLDSEKIITGITHMGNRVQVTVTLEENQANEMYSKLLDILAEDSISIDLINVFNDKRIFTIDLNDLAKFRALMEKFQIKYSYIENCSKICVIGSRMKGIPGVMARILKALHNANINVLQTADSHTTIWCLVEKEYTKAAIKALHKEFGLGK